MRSRSDKSCQTDKQDSNPCDFRRKRDKKQYFTSKQPNRARVKSMASNLTTTVYHNTNEEGAEAIFKEGFIRKSDSTNDDAAFGTGVYVCRKGLEYSKEEIAKNNYDGSTSFYQQQKNEGKANVVLEIEYTRDKVISVGADGRDVCIIKDNIPVNKIKQVHYR